MADSFVKAGYWFVGSDRLPVADIPSKLFTHLYAGFAEVKPDDGGVTFPNQYKQQFESFTTIVRRRNPEVQTFLSIGGEGSEAAISPVMKSKEKRAKFIEDSIKLGRTFKFQGLDLCWLYPSSSDNDADLVSFLHEWRDAVKQDVKGTTNVPLLLTAAVFHHTVITDTGGSFSYPCDTINEKLDWINVLAIDFYTPSNSSGNTGPVHAWRTQPTDSDRCGSDGIGNWIENGVASQKSVLCLPFYGYEWNLDNPCNFVLFAPAHVANILPMSYRTIKPKLKQNNYVPEIDKEYFAAYAHNTLGSWIGYENEWSISKKVIGAIRKTNLRGYFAWHVGADDENWTLSNKAFAPDYPCSSTPNLETAPAGVNP